MAYDVTKTFADYVREVGQQGKAIIEQITRGEETYKNLIVSKDGRTNQQLADALAVDVSYIDDLSSSAVAMHRLFQLLENSATVTQDDFGNHMRKFT